MPAAQIVISRTGHEREPVPRKDCSMTVTEIDVPQAQPTDDEIKAALEKTGARRAALVDLQFSDIAGGIKSLTIPGKLLEHTLRHGYRFDGSALSGGMRRV